MSGLARQNSRGAEKVRLPAGLGHGGVSKHLYGGIKVKGGVAEQNRFTGEWAGVCRSAQALRPPLLQRARKPCS